MQKSTKERLRGSAEFDNVPIKTIFDEIQKFNDQKYAEQENTVYGPQISRPQTLEESFQTSYHP